AAGAFTISRPGYQVFGGKIKLRLVEQLAGATVRTVGQVWAEENAAALGAYPDIRVEYRSITAAIPASPNSITAAGRDGTWSAALIQYGIGRVSLVDVNTKRIYGEHTMPSGLLRSFNVPANKAGQSTASVYYDGFNDTCFLYDQAVALIAYLQLGDEEAARRLVDALLAVQNSDGSYAFAVNQATIFAENPGFIRNGAIAWVCYALLLADKPAFRSWFPERTNVAAQNCLDFMLAYRNDLGLFNGGKGQYVDGVLNPDFVIPWWSCEHNLDIWWCLDLAAELYANAGYADAADTLKEALLAEGVGWNAASGIFWQGGVVSAGENTPDGKHALDMMTWGGAALVKWGRLSDARHAIERAYARYYVTDADTGFSGFTTFAASDGYPAETIPTPWYEGSFGAVACIRLFDPSHANGLMASLVRAQLADGSYQYALKSDPVNEINTFPCLIAAAWNVLAYCGVGTPNQRILWV
ncbi:MAG: hypothetical protein PS018_18665, partial [bacterium]|nr:hypothetical protein [bacterium]